MNHLSDQKIIKSWEINASPWIQAIQKNEIESRLLVTNNAIINTIIQHNPKTVLDIGCGEGWLARELIKKQINVFGIDAIPTLIHEARKINGGTFDVCTYEKLSTYLFPHLFDCLVCNFSLIGKESTDAVIAVAKQLLVPNGHFIIQTMHPITACGDLPYTDGWRAGSWVGFSDAFSNPAPWYFRTIESWKKLLTHSGLTLFSIAEPINPVTKKFSSIIFDCVESRGNA